MEIFGSPSIKSIRTIANSWEEGTEGQMTDEIASAGYYTYNGFADSLKDLMGHLVGQGAYLCQARQSELLSLHGLLQ